MTIVEIPRAITGGVDTHLDINVAAALDDIGGLLGVEEFATDAGRAPAAARLARDVRDRRPASASKAPAPTASAWPARCAPPGVAWSRSIARTGTSGVGKASPTRSTPSKPPGPPCRAELGRRPRPGRERRSDPGADGRQAQRPLGTQDQDAEPDPPPRLLRPRRRCENAFTASRAATLAAEAAALRPRAGRRPGRCSRRRRRCAILGRRRPRPRRREGASSTSSIGRLVADTAPELLALYGVGVDTAAILFVAAGDNPERLRSEAAWAHLCGVVADRRRRRARSARHRLNRGGDRQANHALWRIVMTRMSSDARTRDYVERRARGREAPKREIIRMLKRYIAREVYRHCPAADPFRAAGLAHHTG